MFQATIKSVAVACLLAGVAVGYYCFKHNIRSLDDYRNFRSMRSDPSPIVAALADGTLTAGSTTAEMLAVARPAWTEDYGRYEVYGFAYGGYENRTVAVLDGRLVAAGAGSCTWHWTFFDDTPSHIADAVGSVRGLRSVIDRMPQHKPSLQPMLDAELAKLAAPTAASIPSNP